MKLIPERSKGREKTLSAAQVEGSIALDFTTPIREALTVESAISPNLFWVDLNNLDFSAEAGVQMLDLGVDTVTLQSGEVSAEFKPAEPFQFEPVN